MRIYIGLLVIIIVALAISPTDDTSYIVVVRKQNNSSVIGNNIKGREITVRIDSCTYKYISKGDTVPIHTISEWMQARKVCK